MSEDEVQLEKPLDETNNVKPQKHGHVTARLVFSITSASFGMYTFGWNAGVMSNPHRVVKKFYNETYMKRSGGTPIPETTLTLLWAFTVAIYCAGGMVGGLMEGWWADFFGRKRGLLLNTIFGMVGGLLMALSKPAGSYEMIIVGRLIIGFCCGLYTALAALYNSEVSPYNIRGAVGTINQLFIVFGICMSQIFGLDSLLGNDALWPVLLGVTAIPPFLQLITMPFCPETPRYLMAALKKEDEARAALRSLRGTDDVEEELDEIKRDMTSKHEAKMSILQLVRTRHLRLPVALAIIMHASQQLTGMKGIFYYSRDLFEDVGLDYHIASYATLAVGAIMVVMTFVTIPLMDRLGRKPLHLCGLAGMGISAIMFTISCVYKEHSQPIRYLSISSALLFVLFFAMGPGSVPWLIVAELFSQGPRPAAVSIGVGTNWACQFLVGQSFPSLKGALKCYVFVPFMFMITFFFVFLYIYLPETKHKTIEEITAIFQRKYQAQQDKQNGKAVPMNDIGEVEANSKQPNDVEGAAPIASDKLL